MKKDYTKIIFVVDRSGSMGSIVNDVIGGYNKFIADQKALKHGTCDVSFYQFDTEYDAVYENTPIDFVKDLDNTTFVPRGGTALLDAVGRTIDIVGEHLSKMNESDRPDKILFVILTDGEENSSKKFSTEQVKQKIEHQSNVYKWEFTYLGANQNAWATGTSIGIAYNKNLTYAANTSGSYAAFSSLSSNTRMYRSAVKANFDYEASDVVAQAAAGAAINTSVVLDTLAKEKEKAKSSTANKA